MTTTQLHTSTFVLPLYVQTLCARLCEHSGFELKYASRALDGHDEMSLFRTYENLALNAQDSSVVNGARVVLRNSDGISLTLTWGTFEEDESSADADFSPKARFEHDVRFAESSKFIPVLTAIAEAGFEALTVEWTPYQALRFIRGNKMAGKMRLGIRAELDYGARFAVRDFGMCS